MPYQNSSEVYNSQVWHPACKLEGHNIWTWQSKVHCGKSEKHICNLAQTQQTPWNRVLPDQLRQSRNSLHFIQPTFSLLCSQDTATSPTPSQINPVHAPIVSLRCTAKQYEKNKLTCNTGGQTCCNRYCVSMASGCKQHLLYMVVVTDGLVLCTIHLCDVQAISASLYQNVQL